MRDRIIAPSQTGFEQEADKSLRPDSIEEFVGQETLKENLSISIEAALKRSEPLDHVLLAGPPGLGKTTLANIISNEMGSKLHLTSGPVLDKASDLAGLLTGLEEGDVLFIDEIHRIPRVVEEYLYSAMEDFRLDIMLETGPMAKSVNLPLKKFTLVGATTRSGMLSSPLRDRFGLQFRFNHYNHDELATIFRRSANLLKIEIEEESSILLSKMCRGTPRIANRILKRCRDVADVKGDGSITLEIAKKTLSMLGIDEDGLDEMDRNILSCILEKFDGGPVGLSTIGAALDEDLDTLEEVYEPFLIQEGFLKRTPRGRMCTRKSYIKLGISPPKSEQENLFE